MLVRVQICSLILSAMITSHRPSILKRPLRPNGNMANDENMEKEYQKEQVPSDLHTMCYSLKLYIVAHVKWTTGSLCAEGPDGKTASRVHSWYYGSGAMPCGGAGQDQEPRHVEGEHQGANAEVSLRRSFGAGGNAVSYHAPPRMRPIWPAVIAPGPVSYEKASTIGFCTPPLQSVG